MELKGKEAIVTFDHIGSGMDTFDQGNPIGFAVAGADKVFHNAEARKIGKDKIRVWSDKVTEPVAVRYAWADNPVCNVQNFEGLPLTPFRTDEWKGVTADRKHR